MLFRTNWEDLSRKVKSLYRYFYSEDVEQGDAIYSVDVQSVEATDQKVFTVFERGEVLCRTYDLARLLPFLENRITDTALRGLDNFFQIHSGVVSVGGKALLLPGPPGSGKTTLALGLVLSGFKYLSEEVALIDPSSLDVVPFPRILCFKERSFDALAQLISKTGSKDAEWGIDCGGVHYIDVTDIAADPYGEPAPVGYVIFPRYNPNGKSVLSKISRAEAASRIAQMSLNFSSYGKSGADIAVEIARNAECWALSVGDPEESVSLISEVTG